MIGHGTFFSQFVASTVSATNDLTPYGDACGRFWGAFRNRLTLGIDPITTPPAFAILTTVEVGGTVQRSSRHKNRNKFGPVQYFQTSSWNGSAYTNYVWTNNRSSGLGYVGAGSLIGSYAGVVANPDGVRIGPMQSYQNPYFLPAASGPSASAMAFTAGTTAADPSGCYVVHPEPVYFIFDRDTAETVTVRSVMFREVPLSTLASPINDDLPTTFDAAEPDEITHTTTLYVDAWAVRVGLVGETFAAVRIGEVDPA